MANQSVAYDLDMYKTEPVKIREVKTAPKAAAEPKKKQKSHMGMLCLVTACITAFMLYSQVSLNELNQKLGNAQNDLVTVTTEQNRLNRLVDMKMSDANIEDYATTHLGMIRPDAAQVHYITLSNQNKIEVKEQWSIGKFSAALFDKVRSYFG